jgi:cyclic dehypoxanthinyl futalosine synthase
LGGDIR